MEEIKKTEVFHKRKKDIPKLISSKIDEHEIIYGARALNKQLPKFLREDTTDYDVFSNTPRADAKEAEQALDKSFGGDYFQVEAAQHPGTWKVKGLNGRTYADYTKKPRWANNKVKIKGKNYVELKAIERHLKRTLKDESAKYRWKKDRDALNRIKLALLKKKNGNR